MANSEIHRDMITRVALALGPEFCQKMAFVGGCTTGLLLTDDFTLEQVRHTDDVDLIVHVIGTADFNNLQQQLRAQGFKDSQDPDDPICAMRLGELRVDFMPDDEGILGFSNRWYQDAMTTAEDFPLTSQLTIRLVTPPYFMATKLEAYRGRGNNDPLESRDVEDLLNLIDGRSGLLHSMLQFLAFDKVL